MSHSDDYAGDTADQYESYSDDYVADLADQYERLSTGRSTRHGARGSASAAVNKSEQHPPLDPGLPQKSQRAQGAAVPAETLETALEHVLEETLTVSDFRRMAKGHRPYAMYDFWRRSFVLYKGRAVFRAKLWGTLFEDAEYYWMYAHAMALEDTTGSLSMDLMDARASWAGHRGAAACIAEQIRRGDDVAHIDGVSNRTFSDLPGLFAVLSAAVLAGNAAVRRILEEDMEVWRMYSPETLHLLLYRARQCTDVSIVSGIVDLVRSLDCKDHSRAFAGGCVAAVRAGNIAGAMAVLSHPRVQPVIQDVVSAVLRQVHSEVPLGTVREMLALALRPGNASELLNADFGVHTTDVFGCILDCGRARGVDMAPAILRHMETISASDVFSETAGLYRTGRIDSAGVVRLVESLIAGGTYAAMPTADRRKLLRAVCTAPETPFELTRDAWAAVLPDFPRRVLAAHVRRNATVGDDHWLLRMIRRSSKTSREISVLAKCLASRDVLDAALKSTHLLTFIYSAHGRTLDLGTMERAEGRVCAICFGSLVAWDSNDSLSSSEDDCGQDADDSCVDGDATWKIVALPCHEEHMFHANCIRTWLGVRSSCAICNKRVTLSEVMALL